MTIYRYRLRGPSASDIEERIRTDFSAAPGPVGPDVERDIDLTGPTGATAVAAAKEDLDEYMDFTGWDFVSTAPTTPVPGLGSIIAWGNQSVGGTIADRFMDPWGAQNQIAGTDGVTNARTVITRAGTLRNFFVRHGNPDGNGNDIVYTVRINSVTTALTATLASTGSQASDTVNSVSVVAGDNVDVIVEKAAGIGNSPDSITAQMEFA